MFLRITMLLLFPFLAFAGSDVDPAQGHTKVGVGLTLNNEVTVGTRLGIENVVVVPQEQALDPSLEIDDDWAEGRRRRRRGNRSYQS